MLDWVGGAIGRAETPMEVQCMLSASQFCSALTPRVSHCVSIEVLL